MTSSAQTNADAAQSLALLEAVRQITQAPDQLSLVWEITKAAHSLIGFQRVRLYVADTEDGLIRKRSSIGAEADTEEPARRLSSSNLLGRAVLAKSGPLVWRISDLGATSEVEDGLPTCLMSIPLPRGEIGILVADNPLDKGSISPTDIQCLTILAEFTACSTAHVTREQMGVGFVSEVSHELRTPLTSIRAFTEMLLDGDAGALNDKQLRYVVRIDKGAALLLRLVEDLLELTCLEADNRPLRQDNLSVKPFLEDIVSNLAPQAEAKSICIRVEAERALPTLLTDRQCLQQAVTNLIDNAIKYSPQGSLVRLVASQNNEGLQIAVIDQGPGIRPEEQEKVFNAFYRGYAGQSSLENKGSGLGLSVVRSIARMLGAALRLESEPDKGSTFALIFPLG